jgi:hypothetical protein
MGKASEKDGNRNLTHILIPRDDAKGEIEFRAISKSLATQLLRSINGNEFLFQSILRGELNALQSGQNKRIRCKKSDKDSRPPQKQKESPRPIKGGRAQLLRQVPGPKAEGQATQTGWQAVGAEQLLIAAVKATGQGGRQFTPKEILERAREIL